MDPRPVKPHAPTTGYQNFLTYEMDREREKQGSSYEFASTRDKLAKQWSNMSEDEKRAFEASAKDYQEKYPLYVEQYDQEVLAWEERQQVKRKDAESRKRTKDNEDKIVVKKESEQNISRKKPKLEDLERNGKRVPLERVDFFCKPCRQHFSNVRIYEEHLESKRHKLTVGEDVDLREVVEMPIFTEEFKKHVFDREQEMRELKKAAEDFSERNVLLTKQIADQKEMVQQLNAERGKLEEDVAVISAEVNKMQEWTKENLHGIELPDGSTVESTKNVIDFLEKMASALKSSDTPQEFKTMIETIMSEYPATLKMS
eukprot:m.87502 g.87502  ORF g.87502 m.87502 type:complete len:315 (+) comp13111_c0_seq1:255-1199(+)